MNKNHLRNRKGAVAVLLCFLVLPLLMLLALSVDYGFLCLVQTDLQLAADQAAAAAAMDLVPDSYGDQDLDQVRETLREFVSRNLGEDFSIAEEDIQIGRYNPETIYSDLEILDTGIYDTVQVTLRRDDLANISVGLFFARLFDRQRANVTVRATAILQKAQYLGPGTSVLPIGVDDDAWDPLEIGEQLSIYGDGRLEDAFGDTISGNWGTLDIGDESNSTSAIRDQTINGLSEDDLQSLHEQDVISSNEYIDAGQTLELNGDTGFSAGMKHAMWEIEGETRIIPIYATVTGKGGNTTYEVVKWTAVRVLDFRFAGSKNSYLEVQKSYLYDQSMYPIRDLSDQSDAIENAYTTPVLVQ